MRTIRRIDPKKIGEIQDLVKKCLDADLSEEDRKFAEYKGIPDATRWEHLAANFPIHYLIDGKRKKKIIDPDILRLYNTNLRTFNKTVKDLDMEIIGVDHEFQDLEGKKFKISLMQLAEGIKAKKAAEREEKCSKGHLEKSKRLIEMGNNPELKKSHDAKMRVIRKLLDRRGKKKG